MYTQDTPESTSAILTGIDITPSYFTGGDEITVTFTMRNIAGVRLTGYSMRFGYLQKGGKFRALFDIGSGLANLANRAVKSFRHDVKVAGDAVDAFIASMVKAGDRARGGFVLELTATDTRMTDLVSYYPVDAGCAMIDRLYRPDIPVFALERLAGDAGDSDDMLAITAKLTAETPAGDLFGCRLFYACGHAPTPDDSFVDLSDCIGALLDGTEHDATMVDVRFDKAYDWFFMLAYGDEYETAGAHFTVGQRFTNRHESGYESGGVRYGGYSRSTPGHPLFESDYPAFFYGGVANIQCGVVPAAGMTGAGHCTDIPVTFAQPFAEGCVPVVVAGFLTTSTAGPFGRCCVGVLPDSISNTGFTLRFYNGDNAGRDPAFSYVAIGVPTPAIN